MRLTIPSLVLTFTLLPLTASAQSEEDDYSSSSYSQPSTPKRSSSGSRPKGFLIGAETSLTAPVIGVAARGFGPPAGAVALGWDARDWRAEGLLSLLFQENQSTAFGMGGRFWYVLHNTKHADFSVGGLMGFSFQDFNPGGEVFLFHLEPSVQMRAFIVSNMAITATLGMGLAIGDLTVVGLLGQVNGALGLTYVFD